jgi:predicted Ser/Thr protein kinase
MADQRAGDAEEARRPVTAPGSPYLPDGAVLAGRYAVSRELGRGGFSVVYLARDRSLDTDVAIKLLVPPPAAAAVARERMRREVQAVRGLSHASLVAVHDFVDDGPWSFVVMEYVAGPNLSQRVRQRGPLAAEEVRRLGCEVAQGLALAHRNGVIHRDVKPENILLDADGRARLTDFGSARLEGVTGVTRTGGLVGTLDYLAPEVLAGRRGDGRADLYALGLTLHFALTGRLPERPSLRVPIPASTDGHRPSRLAGAPRIPGWLDDVIARATVAAPERRFPSAQAMEEALARGAAGLTETRNRVEVVPRCALCREVDPFGMGLCVRCGGTSPHSDDRAIVVRPPLARRDREPVRQAVRDLLGDRVDRTAAAAAAAGERTLLRVPAGSTGTVLEHLAGLGIPAGAVLPGRVWAELPVRFYLMLLSMTVLGVAAGSIVPVLAWASPAVAGIWWVLAFREIGRPALASVGLATPLPADAEREIVAALTELPSGTARDLLADIVRVGQRVLSLMRSGPDDSEDIAAVLSNASRAATQVAGLDDSLASLEQRPEAAGDERLISAVAALERSRDRLVQQLLEVLTALGRIQGRLASGAAGGREESLSGLTAALEASLGYRVEAESEVEALLEAAPTP